MQEEKKYALIKLNTGETLIGDIIPIESSTHTTIRNPLVFQILTITNSFGMKLKDLLQFKRWFEFSDDVELTISNISIISVATADSMIIKFYEVELERYTEKKKAETNRLDNPEEEIEDDDHGGVKGNLSLDFNFQDQDQLQMFMENIQMGIEGLLDEMHDDGIEEEDQENNNLNFEDGEFEDGEEDVHPKMPPFKSKSDLPPKSKPSAKWKNVKPKMLPSTFNYKYDPSADSKDPSSWPDNPEDYFKE